MRRERDGCGGADLRRRDDDDDDDDESKLRVGLGSFTKSLWPIYKENLQKTTYLFLRLLCTRL